MHSQMYILQILQMRSFKLHLKQNNDICLFFNNFIM